MNAVSAAESQQEETYERHLQIDTYRGRGRRFGLGGRPPRPSRVRRSARCKKIPSQSRKDAKKIPIERVIDSRGLRTGSQPRLKWAGSVLLVRSSRDKIGGATFREAAERRRPLRHVVQQTSTIPGNKFRRRL